MLLHPTVCKQFCWPLQFTVKARNICCSNLSKKSFIIEIILCRGYTSLNFWKDQTVTLIPNSFPKTNMEENSYFLTFQGESFQGCSWVGGPKRPCSLKSVTHILQLWYLKTGFQYKISIFLTFLSLYKIKVVLINMIAILSMMSPTRARHEITWLWSNHDKQGLGANFDVKI